jgi:Tfp pilus assembly protein PilF
MEPRHKHLAAIIVALYFSVGAVASAGARDAGDAAQLGKVHFKVECNAAAQKEFDLAMAYYHSFAWEQYKAPLERTLQADPGCGMAHWLRAFSVLDNPFVWPANLSPKIMAEGAAALEAARSTGLKSQRERDYVEALATFYKDYDKLNHPTRTKALESALEQVAQRYPEDTEASILYALILSRNFDPQDKKYTNQLKATRILEPIFLKQPEHPGVAHYLVHSYDYPPIAQQGLEAARRYSKIAPGAAHALHMPSHIFTRVGYWKDSVGSNRASANSAKASIPNWVHALDYMVYAHLQMGQERAASEALAESRRIGKYADNFAVAYGMAAMPGRMALERGAWREAASLQIFPAPDAYPWNKHPQAVALNAFARGVGAAGIKDVAAAQAEVKRLRELRDAAAALKFGYWVEQIDIQAEVVRGLSACAEGKHAEGIEILGKAAAREDATEKHAVTPGLLVPAREALAQSILSFAQASDALREFEAVLVREPNRYRATLGAAQAADKAGDRKKAAFFYGQLLQLAKNADTPRAELTEAKRYLGTM